MPVKLPRSYQLSSALVASSVGAGVVCLAPAGFGRTYRLHARRPGAERNRLLTRALAAGKSVLNCFCYTGGFGVYALKGGAKEVVNVDLSQNALDIARQNAELNGLDTSTTQFVRHDVFKLLREYREKGEKFDVIVLDPPKFAESKAQLLGACRGYKDINMLAFQLLAPGGVLLTYSCSGLMEQSLFQKIVADAALDAGRDAQILELLSQASDHPIGTAYPEGFYLKGLVVRAR